MNRRNFISWVGLGWVVTIIGGAIASCTNQTSKTENSREKNSTQPQSETPSIQLQPGQFVRVGSVKDLEAKGSILIGKTGSAAALVIRDANNQNTLTAVNPTCTHQGCGVDWDNNTGKIFCPCHGSTFKADGSVTNGPAKEALKKYEAKIEGDDIMVKAS